MKKIISIVLLISVFAVTVFAIPSSASTLSGVTISNTTMYSNAGTPGHTVNKEPSSAIKSLNSGTTFDILDKKTDGDGDLWYLVKLSDGTTGYLYSARTKITKARYYDADFEKNLKNFPAEYHEALRGLHSNYPNWRFFAEPTNCTFEQALEAEYRSGADKTPLKLVELTYMGDEWRDPRANNGDGTWKNAEGSGRWTYASSYAISYFLNPLNFLNNNNIYMFLQLSYESETQTKAILSSVVSGTFLNNDVYLNAIMKAASESGMSPYAIASLIIIEQGSKGQSNLISGNYPGFEGYYNFFNVGASGQTNNDIATSGLKYAKEHGWDTPEKAIIGGAVFSSNGYINAGQDTYYYMDYNVVKGDYNHQYATAIYDAYNKGNRLKNAFIDNKNATLDFVIPVFSSSVPTTNNPPPVVIINYGDINHDNVVDVIDAALMRKHILNISPLTISKNPEADINKDGVIDVIDAAKIRKHILNIELIR